MPTKYLIFIYYFASILFLLFFTTNNSTITNFKPKLYSTQPTTIKHFSIFLGGMAPACCIILPDLASVSQLLTTIYMSNKSSPTQDAKGIIFTLQYHLLLSPPILHKFPTPKSFPFPPSSSF